MSGGSVRRVLGGFALLATLLGAQSARGQEPAPAPPESPDVVVCPPAAGAIRIDGDHPELTARVARELGQRLAQRMPPPSHGVRLLGPAPAPIARIKGRTRWQLLIKGPTHASFSPLLDLIESRLPELPSSVKVVIDVDPTAML